NRYLRFCAACFVFATVVLIPNAAWAHGAESPRDTDYRVTISRAPDLPDVEVRVVEAGARLELRNRGDDPIEILGYSSEPYAEVRPEGVFVNLNSPAAYLTTTIDGHATVSESASPAAPPRWRRASDEPVFRWHDHR